jgi:hypothetical protein
VSAQSSPEDVVRRFFDCYTDGPLEDFDEVVAPDYFDYGHTPPRRGPGGARDDYRNAVKQAGTVIRYAINVLVADGDMVAAAVDRHAARRRRDRDRVEPIPDLRRLPRSTRHALIGNTPS